MLNEKFLKGNKYMSNEFHILNYFIIYLKKKNDTIQVKIERQFNTN